MSTDGGSTSDEPTLADYLDAYRVRFLKVFDADSSKLDRCKNYFQSVANTPALLDSHTNSVITGDFQSDIASIGQMKRLEDVKNVIDKWVSKFAEMANAAAAAGTGTPGHPAVAPMDVDQDEDDVEEDDDPNVLSPETMLKLSGVKRRQETIAEDTEWIEKTNIRQTRAQAKQREAETQPVHYVDASHIMEGAEFKKLRQAVTQEFKRLIDKGDDYWDTFHPDPKLWANTDPDVRRHVESLKIPAVPLQNMSVPDMLLHCLGTLGQSSNGVPALDSEMEARLKPLMDSADWDYFLKNASGVGKTRLMFELLAKAFGLYFNFDHKPSNPHGSCDTTTAYDQLEHGMRNLHATTTLFQKEVKGVTNDERTVRRTNGQIAGHLYSLLVFARVLVFGWFVDAYTATSGMIDDDAVRLWCLLQIRPLLRGRGQARFDVFNKVFQSVLMIDASSCKAQTTLILRQCEEKGARISFLMLDEVHVPAATFPTAFEPHSARSQKQGKTRPLLKPALQAIRAPFLDYLTRVLVAATEFNSDVINEAVGSSLMKGFSLAPQAFMAFGEYALPSELENTMLHFLGKKFVSGLTDALRADINFWLTGRRRFLSTFIQWTIQQGATNQAAERVLRQIVTLATGGEHAGTSDPIPGFAFRNLVPEGLRGEQIDAKLLGARATLQHAVIYFIIKGKFPAFSSKVRILVTLGLGCFVPPAKPGDEETVVVKESLVLTSALNWLNGTPENSLINVLDHALSDIEASPRGYAFEDVVQYILWEAFSAPNGAPLNSVFKFRFLEPSWQGESGILVESFKRTSFDGETHTLSASTTARMGYKATTPEETCSWFRPGDARSARIPFLQPDHKCGPDLVLCLLLPGGVELLVCVQCKCWSQKHYKGDVLKAVKKMSPEGFYHTKKATEQASSAANRASLVNELKQFPATPAKPMPTVAGSSAEPKHTMIRVLATFDAAVAWPKFDATYGAYPIASLNDEFMKSATLKFSALEHAYELASRNSGSPSIID